MKYIYGLLDPISNKIRYVGQTDNLTQRLQQHLQDTSNTPKVEWIKALKSTNTPPKMIVLSEVKDGENAHEIEYRWIYFGRQNGWPLTNTVAMKTQEYYSLQGYFERLIVEMEKPESVKEKKRSWSDIVDGIIYLTTTVINFLPNVVGQTLGVIPAAFNILSTLWYVLYVTNAVNLDPKTTKPNEFIFAMIALLGGVVSFFVTVLGERQSKFLSGICFVGVYLFFRFMNG